MKMPIAVSKVIAVRSKLVATIAATAALLAYAPAANAATFNTSGVAFNTVAGEANYGFGDTLHTQFDALKVDTAAGSLVANTTIQLDKLTFIAGFMASPSAVNHYTFSENVTVAGAAIPTKNISFDLYIDSSHKLTIPGGQTLSFLVGASLWTLVVNGLTITPGSGSPQFGYLTAQVTETAATPLPAAILLFGSGLGAMGLFSRRRKAKASAAAAA